MMSFQNKEIIHSLKNIEEHKTTIVELFSTNKVIAHLNELLLRKSYNKVLIVCNKNYIYEVQSSVDHENVTVINLESLHHCNTDFDLVVILDAIKLAYRSAHLDNIQRLRAICLNVDVLVSVYSLRGFSDVGMYKQLYAINREGNLDYEKWMNRYISIHNGKSFDKNTRYDLRRASFNKDGLEWMRGVYGKYVSIKQPLGVFTRAFNTVSASASEIVHSSLNLIFRNNYLKFYGQIINFKTHKEKLDIIRRVSAGTVKTPDGQNHILCNDKMTSIRHNAINRGNTLYVYCYTAELEMIKLSIDLNKAKAISAKNIKDLEDIYDDVIVMSPNIEVDELVKLKLLTPSANLHVLVNSRTIEVSKAYELNGIITSKRNV